MSYKSLELGSNTSLLIKIETVTVITCLAMRNKFGYCCSIKICASRYNKLLESIFDILLAVEVFSLQKVVEMLEQVVAGWVNTAGEAKLRSPILSSFEVLIV